MLVYGECMARKYDHIHQRSSDGFDFVLMAKSFRGLFSLKRRTFRAVRLTKETSMLISLTTKTEHASSLYKANHLKWLYFLSPKLINLICFDNNEGAAETSLINWCVIRCGWPNEW